MAGLIIKKSDLQPAFYVPQNDQGGSARNKHKLSSKPLLSTRLLTKVCKKKTGL